MIRSIRQFSRFTAAGVLGVLFASCAAAQAGAEDLRLTVGKSVVIDYPSDIRQISTSAPDVLDASPVTTREILVHGKGLGTATMVVWSKTGQRTFYNVTVELNLESLRRLLQQTFPSDKIQVQSSRDSIALTGSVSSKEDADRALALAAPFAKTVVSNLGVAAGPVEKQVLLRVKFAQLDRTREIQYGVNLFSTGATNTLGRVTTQQFGGGNTFQALSASKQQAVSQLTISDALNIFAFRPDLNLAAFVKALQSENILEILAEPNLVTSDGKEASFLVGGEFPIPVLQGGSNAGAVTIQFREFGIRLYFTPVVTANKTIQMHLRQEVSTIDFANSVTFSGFTIPGLSTRRAETNIELGEGQSFVVAGLINNQESDVLNKIPGLASLPILGALFKTRDERKQRTDLVMIVTPELTQPLNANQPAPIPTMPRDFLVPLNPSAKAGAAGMPGGKKRK